MQSSAAFTHLSWVAFRPDGHHATCPVSQPDYGIRTTEHNQPTNTAGRGNPAKGFLSIRRAASRRHGIPSAAVRGTATRHHNAKWTHTADIGGMSPLCDR